jgi:hypothetical protein
VGIFYLGKVREQFTHDEIFVPDCIAFESIKE